MQDWREGYKPLFLKAPLVRDVNGRVVVEPPKSAPRDLEAARMRKRREAQRYKEKPAIKRGAARGFIPV